MTRWLRAAGVALLLISAAAAVRAHAVPPSVVMLDIGAQAIDVDLELPAGELARAMALAGTADATAREKTASSAIRRYVAARFALHSRDGRAYAVAGQSLSTKKTTQAEWTDNDWVVVHTRYVPPAGASTAAFRIDDTVIVERVVSHESLVHVRRDVRNGLAGDRPVLVSTVGYGHTRVDIDGSGGSWARGFATLFALGMRHIADGPDHVLFLLALLLPAPFVARAGRWREPRRTAAALREVGLVVTGFTLAHTLALALACAGTVALPARGVEVAIAVSILVACAHAGLPLFPGREVAVAFGFGLVHGLAFAETLQGLGFDATTLAVSLTAFNLGTEAMQLAVVAATLPLLLALARTRAGAVARTGAAGFAAACAAGWLVERAGGAVNPLQRVVGALAPPPAWLAALVATASAACVLRWLLREAGVDRGRLGNALSARRA